MQVTLFRKKTRPSNDLANDYIKFARFKVQVVHASQNLVWLPKAHAALMVNSSRYCSMSKQVKEFWH
jgi:hypothetical protein